MPRRRIERPDWLAAALVIGWWLSPVAPPARAAAPSPAAAAPRAQAAAAGAKSNRQPIVIDAASSHVDYETNTVAFRNVVVSQGETRVTAERAHATGVGFTNSQWTFEGQVSIALAPREILSAEQATVEFRDDRVAQATATGEPARFEVQRTDASRDVHGQAERIVYTARDDSVRLSGSASLSDGHGSRISGPVLVYDIGKEQLRAISPDVRRRVQITVAPRTARKSGQAPASEPP